MNALVVFDIEAVPDFDAARRLLGQPSSTADADIRRMLGERYSRNQEEPTTAFLKVPIYRIVSIATLNAKREDGGGPWTVSQIGSRSVGEKTETESLPVMVPRCGSKGRSIQVPKLTLCGSCVGAAMAAPTTVCIDSSAAIAIRMFWNEMMQGSERSVMYKHILIPTDGSELSMKAVEHGVLLARALKARVTSITVMSLSQIFEIEPASLHYAAL
jgi:hypothetical protein